MPKTFEDFGIRFMYPDNWESVAEDSEQERAVTLQLPSGGFCSIIRDDRDVDDELLINEIADAVASEYEEVETESIDIDDYFDSGVARELRFYYLDLLVISRLFVTDLADQRFIIQFQAESRDFDENELVFSAITKQLRDSD